MLPFTLSLPLCLGTGNFGAALDQNAAFALLDAYQDHGGAFLDSAKVYCDWIGDNERSSSEKIIGRWLKARRNRDHLVIATKGAHPDLGAMHIPRMTRSEIEADLDASLRNLQTDVIDLYWLHRDDPAHPVAEILIKMRGHFSVRCSSTKCGNMSTGGMSTCAMCAMLSIVV